MPYSVSWYIENEIIFVRYYGTNTVDELREALLTTKALIESSPRQLVHVINDIGDIEEGVSLKDSLPIVREVGGHPRAGWSITLREKSALMKMGAALGASVFKMRYRAFGTLEEVMAHLKSMDQTINWDKVNPSAVAHLQQAAPQRDRELE